MLLISPLFFFSFSPGGDFPEEMGQNLESGLVIENENILKIRKDEESDELVVQNDINCAPLSLV